MLATNFVRVFFFFRVHFVLMRMEERLLALPLLRRHFVTGHVFALGSFRVPFFLLRYALRNEDAASADACRWP